MEAIQLLKELISINSVFPNEKQLAEYLEMHLIELGFTIKRIPVSEGRFNLVAERGTQGKSIAFYGHMDTVPAYGKWKKPPFETWEDGDKLHGLGSMDMKAGLAAILKACDFESDRKIKIAFGVDEENISEGAQVILKSGFLNDCEGIVVTEAGQSDKLALGTKMITLGRRGHPVYEITIPGKSSHGAHVHLGINAINEAARFVLALEKLQLPNNNLFPPATQFVRSFNASNSSLSIPDVAIIELDRHTIPPETSESVLNELRVFIDSLYSSGQFKEIEGKRITVKLKERKTPYLDPYVTNKEHSFVKRLATAVTVYHKCEPIYNYGSSVADENVFAKIGLPVVTIGSLGGNEHSADEWVSKQSYFDLIEILRNFILSN
ncbi:MAG: M20/M25/M40 family metallo-hydrolase [Candidatus Micrarchaeota archaeon]|nr:M20/M25/M40 family metallo-hydrolase [Candidatus Micrarchaeota archaeon]